MIQTDAVVIGAGPVGLFQAFQLGLQEIGAHIIEALPQPGGQCAQIYPDKPIYDIPGLPVCSGRELTARLLQQIAPFKIPLHLGQQVLALARQSDGRLRLETSLGLVLLARTVFIAAGVGAFVPRKPDLAGLHDLEQNAPPQIHYSEVDPHSLAGQRVVVMGGEDAALQTALQLASCGLCASVTLLHRVNKFQAQAGLEHATRSAIAQGLIQLVLGQPVGLECDDTCTGPRLRALRLATPDCADGASVALALDAWLPRLGLSPRLGPIADWGLAMERKQIVVNNANYATSEPGVFAVGDVNTYPGKRKLILCGFHEATLAAYAAAPIVHPGRRQVLQYTTTSTRLHELLGVGTKTGAHCAATSGHIN